MTIDNPNRRRGMDRMDPSWHVAAVCNISEVEVAFAFFSSSSHLLSLVVFPPLHGLRE